MNCVERTFLSISILLFTPAWGQSAIKAQDVIDAVLNKSLEAQSIALDKQLSFVQSERAQEKFDFKLIGKTSYEYREAETLSGLSNAIDKTLSSDLSVKKSTRWGSHLSMGYLHQTQSSILNSLTTSTREPTLTLDTAYIELRQNLWANALGASDRWELQIARINLVSSDLLKQEATEDLILTALRAFWEAYVAQTQLKDAITARQMYKELTEVVKRRGRFGLERGGEYAQVMADYTSSESQVKTASYRYLEKLKILENLMQENFSQDLEFLVEEEVPPLPKFNTPDYNKLRKIIVAESALQNARHQANAIGWRAQPQLDLIARSTSTGVDVRASAAYSEFIAGTKPTYYIGLEFSTALDSSQRRASQAEARVTLDRQQNHWHRVHMEIKTRLNLLERRLEQTHLNAAGALQIEKYRARTVREQETEYRNGRLSLRELLDTYRRFFDSQSERVRAIGDYHLALNEMAAERDELVK